MDELKEQLVQLPIADEIQAVIKGEGVFDRTITEEEAKQFLPQLLLAGEQQGISASELGPAIHITEKGTLEIKNAKIQVDHPQFKGAVILSAEIFNERPWVLATRNLDAKVEGGNMITRSFAGKLIRDKLGKPHDTIVGALREQVKKQSQGTRKLDKFGVQINGENKSVRIYLETAPVR